MVLGPDVIAGVMFVLIMLFVMAMYSLVRRLAQDPIGERLARMSAADGSEAASVSQPFVDGLADQLPQMNFGNGELERDLRRAGAYRPNALKEFLAFRNLLMISAVIITGMVAVGIGPENGLLVLQVLLAGLIITFLCWSVPRIIISLRARARVYRITEGLPAAMEMIHMCISGGLPLSSSISHVSREIYQAHPDLSVELSILGEQARMTTLSEAFRQFGKRIDSPDVIALAALVQQNQRLGSNVADSIEEYVDTVKEQRQQLAEERAGKASVHLLFPVVLCLVPAVTILLWGPALLELMEFIRSFEGPPPSLG